MLRISQEKTAALEQNEYCAGIKTLAPVTCITVNANKTGCSEKRL